MYITHPPKTHKNNPWMDKDWIYDQYIIKDRSSLTIAKNCGCAQSTIQNALWKLKISKPITKHDRVYTKPYQSKEFLYTEHLVNNKSITQISKEQKVSDDTIIYFMKKFGIEYHKDNRKVLLDKENEVIRLYIDEKLSTTKIGQIFGCSHRAILRILKDNNIQIRNLSDSHLCRDMDEKFYDKEYLEFQHIQNNISCKDLAKEFSVDAGTTRRQMKRLGIKTKTNSESKIGIMIGDKHPNWQGGITDLHLLVREYFTTNISPLAIARDEGKCQLCGCENNLHAHHIRHFKTIFHEILNENSNLDPIRDKYKLYDIIVHDKRFIDLNNLITVCSKCHKRLHSKKKTISSEAP